MGFDHNELTSGELAAAIRNALGVTAPDSGLDRFGETLTPIINLWQQPEWALLRSELLGAGFRIGSQAAGTSSQVCLINPAGSERLVVVEQIIVSTSGVTPIEILTGVETDFATLATGPLQTFSRDLRIGAAAGSARAPRAYMRSGDVAGRLGNALVRLDSQSIGDRKAQVPFVLPPGTGVNAAAVTVNIPLPVAYVFRERSVRKGELTTGA